MRTVTTTELACMEVINLCDGARLGYPSAVELNVDDRCATAILVPKETGFLCFGKQETYRIPWCRIECIGEDTILIKMTDGDLAGCCCQPSGRRRRKL